LNNQQFEDDDDLLHKGDLLGFAHTDDDHHNNNFDDN